MIRHASRTARVSLSLTRVVVALFTAAIATGALWCAAPSAVSAQVITAFSSRYSTNDTGDIAIVGNTLLTCPSGSNCTAAQAGSGSTVDDNDFRIGYVDVDSDATPMRHRPRRPARAPGRPTRPQRPVAAWRSARPIATWPAPAAWRNIA